MTLDTDRPRKDPDPMTTALVVLALLVLGTLAAVLGAFVLGAALVRSFWRLALGVLRVIRDKARLSVYETYRATPGPGPRALTPGH